MGNEIDRGFVSEISILGGVVVLISKSTDDTISSESLVHEGVHWSMKSMANSVELIIHTKVWLHDEVEQDDEACKENNDPVAQVDQDHENTEKSEPIIENSVETMK